MIVFAAVLGSLVGITILIQLITNMKIVGGNELGVVTGSTRHKGFRTLSGGRAFVIPLFQRFSKFDLTPITIEVVVESAIAAGIVPLNVKATVSFAIAGNEAGRSYAVTRILNLASDRKQLAKIAGDIIEGHLRDSIASVTPEQVMKDKDALVSKMINVCKADLENIGLQITTMNIADVDDHRLPGVEEPDLYIALLKRIQSASAETRAREAQAEAKAAAAEQAQARRAETEVRNMRNELDRLKAEVRVALAQQTQRQQVGVEQVTADAKARVSGVTAELEAEKQNIELLRNRYRAEIITPAQALKEKAVLDAKAEVASWFEVARTETEQLEVTLKTIQEAGKGKSAWLIENFDSIFKPFTETLAHYPVDHVSIITGAGGNTEPISAIHPNAVAKARNEIVEDALKKIAGKKS
ncbi:MAG: SPFH domain-containing protein [Treponema sp.]|nr:SPFH domain-containing protein [Treponema sp.]MCL2272595.1 SPFH domain-containing protein [Treponema sp.]